MYPITYHHTVAFVMFNSASTKQLIKLLDVKKPREYGALSKKYVVY